MSVERGCSQVLEIEMAEEFSGVKSSIYCDELSLGPANERMYAAARY